MLAGGAALLLASLLSVAGLAVAQSDGYPWADGSLVPADGAPHTVELSSGRSAMVWSYAGNATPTCTVFDASTGEVLQLTSVDGSYGREGGSAGDWIGVAAFQPLDATVEVTCAFGDRAAAPGLLTVSSGVLVAVETAPAMPPPVATFGPWGALPVALALAGLLAVLAGALMNTRRRAGAPTR